MGDRPGYDDKTLDDIGKTYKKKVVKIITEFETFAFCVDGRDSGVFLQSKNLIFHQILFARYLWRQTMAKPNATHQIFMNAFRTKSNVEIR